jgi:hypothetical protein
MNLAVEIQSIFISIFFKLNLLIPNEINKQSLLFENIDNILF